ncbi:MAG: preprotein translocase subunit SecY, partial [Gemmataceae bacterium]|nr:preprotein translocase subunit SecY [Gemmataceae bacterium]
MFAKFASIFAIPELRQKIWITVILLAVSRIGFSIPLPFVDQREMNKPLATGGLGQLLQYVSMFSGGDLSHATIFGLGIAPYITASIIFMILGSVYPPLAELRKEGMAGQRKINEYTRYATVLFCLMQGYFYVSYLMSPDQLGWSISGYNTFFFRMVMILIMTTGGLFLMWIGEQIDEYGIGNGISLIIMAGIVSRLPAA